LPDRPKNQILISPAALDLGVVLLLLFLRIYASWMEWVDLVVDFGRELYVPWRITQGAALYRDIAWFSGPFSAYFNAAVFSVGGVSVTSLAIANALVAATTVIFLYFILREVASRVAAVAGCGAFVFLFSCGPMLGSGLFNWMAPYSHDLTHGFALSAAAVLCLLKFLKHPRPWLLYSCGLFMGIAFLTKPEIFLALTAAVSLALLLIYFPKTSRPPLPWLAGFIIALILPTLLAAGLLSLAMPPSQAAHGIFGGWPALLDPRITNLPFYRWVRGTKDFDVRMQNTAVAFSVTLAIVAASIALAWFLGPRLQARRSRAIVLAAIIPLVFLFFLPAIVSITPGHLEFAAFFLKPPADFISPLWAAFRDSGIAQPFPFFLIALIILHAVVLFRRRNTLPRPEVLCRLTLLVFALALQAKIFFYVRFEHYSFVLNVAATVTLIAAAVDWLPPLLKPTRAPLVLRTAMLLLIAFAIATQCPMNGTRQAEYRFGDETFYAGPRKLPLLNAVQYLKTNASPKDTVAVFPEGAMINFLTRRPNSTPYVNVMPLEYMMYGPRTILDTFAAHPPTYVILVHRRTNEYGVDYFGADYAPELMQWVRLHYHSVALFGSPPLQPPPPGVRLEDYFGIEIYKYNSLPPAAPASAEVRP
jgi:hypothetical protein